MTSKEALEHIVNNDYNTIITTYPSQQAYNGLTKKEMVEIIKKDLDKLSQLEDIEEELGIDLITLFKASNKCFCKIGNDIFEGFIEEIYITDLQVGFKSKENDLFELCFKGYGKTWALTKEELENETH